MKFKFHIAASMLLLSPYAAAENWLIAPSLDLKETYTDNVRLAIPANAREDWITQIDPGISLSRASTNLKFKANYQLQNFLYKNARETHKENHLLNSDVNAKLLGELLFLDGKASISQQSISTLGQLELDNAYITGNQATIATYSLSPYLLHQFGTFATSELRYSSDGMRSRVTGLSNSSGESTLLKLKSGVAFNKLGWALSFNKQKTDYSSSPTIGTENLLSNISFPVSSEFNLIGSAGYEKSNYATIGQKPEGLIRSAGFSWTPSERTSIEATAGRRYFGRTFMLQASQRTPKTVWSLDYNDSVTTAQSEFLISTSTDTKSFLSDLYAASFPNDPIALQQYVDYVISFNNLPALLSTPVNYLSNRVFLQRSLQASVAINSAKSTLILSAFAALRTAQTSATADSALLGTSNLVSNDRTKQLGGNASWVWQVTSRTNFDIMVNASATGRKNYTHSFQLSLSRQLEPKLRGVVGLRLAGQHANHMLDSGYKESAIFASLSMKF